jgi:uncharacterized protein DUF3658
VRPSTVHIVFGPAENLEAALRLAGREDRIACHRNNLAIGPIDPPDLRARQVWCDRELPVVEPNEERFPDDEAFWNEALREHVRKVAWMSRRSAPEYCAFLEWLWRLDEQPCEVIDLTDMPVGKRRRAFLLSLLDAEEIVEDGLLDRTKHLDATARARYRSIWRRLRAENAPLRVVGPDGLQSARLTYFDAQLLSFAQPSWQWAVRLVAEVMVEWVGSEMEPYFQAGDGILANRVVALVEAGLLEERGNLLNMRECEVRLANQG